MTGLVAPLSPSAASSTPVVRHSSVVPLGFLLRVVDRWAFNGREPLFNGHLRTRAEAVVLVGGRASSSALSGPAVNRSPLGFLVLHSAVVAGAHPRRAASHRLHGSGDAGFRSLTSPAGRG